MADAEFMKEYLRRAFHEGALDLGRDRETLEGFLRIFAGEMETIIAIDHAGFYLSEEEQKNLIKIAIPTARSVREYRAWADRISAGT